MRATVLLTVAVLLVGCRDKVLPGSKIPEVTAEQLAALQAGNTRLAAKLAAYAAETKKLPDTLEALRTWAKSSNTWDPEDDKAMNDPWGNPVVFSQVPTIGLTYTIRSAGADQKIKTTDDLIFDNRDKTTMTFKERNEK